MTGRPFLLAVVLTVLCGGLLRAESQASSPDVAAAGAQENAPPLPVEHPKRDGKGEIGAPVKTLTPPAEEIAYRSKVKALLAGLIGVNPSADDIAALNTALKARTIAAANALTDPAARKLALWQAYKFGVGDADDMARFVAQNPAWPDSQTILRRAEEQMLARGGNSAEIRGFFKGREPVSGAGWAALASAHLAEGDEAAARRHAARAWTDEEMAASFETGFLDRFGKMLTPADHRQRLDRLLVSRFRFAAERRARAAIARRVIPQLPEAERKVAEARLAVLAGGKNAGKLLAELPADSATPTDWGLAFSRAAHHLDSNHLEEAAKILTRIPDDAEKLVNPDEWWLLRREAAYDALTARKPHLAYDLVKTSGPLSANPLKEQSHMAGWIAFRLLKNSKLALTHFETALKAADGPLSRARSAYWTGRVLDVLGRKSEARQRYLLAMRDADTFHGLLARQIVTGGPHTDLTITPPLVPSKEEAERFKAHDAVRAATLARKAGLDRNIFIGLMAGLRNYLKTEGEMALLAELAASLGDPQTSLRVAKTAIARGMNLILYAYPIDPFPDYEPIRPPPETAMLLGITRQETEFNTAIVSWAGARGLMQVMPVTARHVCTQHKVKCDLPKLMTDHAYNVRIASAYIADRMSELGGWYAVSLAAYNAGPGRARQWIRQNGDPRGGDVDPIDWIERIPIEETRLYVEKVLSNIQVYRARLGEPKALRLVEDLNQPTGRGNARRRAGAD
ncbi:MAG: lytic transglycosylase domain-containing protein [Hyphomicrobiaceae bacterium]